MALAHRLRVMSSDPETMLQEAAQTRPRTLSQRAGCWFLLVWLLWSAMCGAIKAVEVISMLCRGGSHD